MRSFLNGLATVGLAALAACSVADSASAGTLLERAERGDAIRLGFSSEPPFAFPGKDGSPKGLFNVYTIAVLKKMGFTKVEPVLTDWGGLIPGLTSDRIDIVTGGMAVLGARCQNIVFSEPVAKVGDGFIVAPGNPKKIGDYKSVADSGAIMVTGAGYANIKKAREAGVAEDHIMQVPGPTEMLAAVKSGRADAGAGIYLNMKTLANASGGAVETADSSTMPADSFNWSGIGFRKSDRDFVDKFNAAQAGYLGSKEMMDAVAEYGYDMASLPGDKTTEWLCKNR